MFVRAMKSVSVCFAALLVARAASANITILEQPGLGSFTSMQSAINAAVDGDVLLVHGGTYSGFTIDGKSLTLVATQSVLPTISGTSTVKNLTNTQSVSLVGLTLAGANNLLNNWHALVLTDDDGIVRVQGCVVKGAHYAMSSGPFFAGHGILATNCKKVLCSGSTLTGSDAGLNSGEQPTPGADGLRATDSTISLYDCTLKGGRGSDETDPAGGAGGAGCRVTNFGVFVSGSTLRGGNGGGGDYLGCTAAGNGGDALVIDGAQAQLLDVTYIAGLGNGYYTCAPGVDGQTINSNGGVAHDLGLTRRKLTAPIEVTDQAPVPLVFTGQPGDQVWLLATKRQAFVFLLTYNGTLTVPMPMLPTAFPVGTIGASGTLNYNLPIADLPGPEHGWIRYLQGICFQAPRVRILTSPLQLLVKNL